jgi:Na+/proline symporter
MIGADIQTTAALVLYLVIILGIGFWASIKIKSHRDYYIGGKKLPGWALALSERSTDMSAWLVIGVPALAYRMGVSALWIPVGCYLGSIIQWIFYSKKLREERDEYDAVTAVDYLAKKHPDGAVGIRILGAITCFYFTYSMFQLSLLLAEQSLTRPSASPCLQGWQSLLLS